jgi:hypothetical protein
VVADEDGGGRPNWPSLVRLAKVSLVNSCKVCVVAAEAAMAFKKKKNREKL